MPENTTTPVEDYALGMVVGGAESTVEDDLNEDGDLSDADHEKACTLAIRIIRGMEANPGAVLALAVAEEA